MRSITTTLLAATAFAVALGSMAPGLTPPAAAQEQPVAPETNPPGDIPDSQVFVTYTSPAGFSLKVPEGWALTELPDGASFADKYGRIDIALAGAASAPTPKEVGRDEAAKLVKSGRAVRISAIRQVTLPAGPAVLIVYTSNSDPNAVTDKQIRLENNRYLFYRAGHEAALTLSAPAGADNVDQWQLMANSFRWN
ncbi:MAG TPA: hypothetical protein VGH25_00505 [Dongiaceae bacterium]